MFTNLKVRGYRGLSDFSLSPLGRVNLLVGGNNTGKTSILESLQLLMSVESSEGVAAITGRRGEYSYGNHQVDGRIAHLVHMFAGHELELGSSFSVSAESGDNLSTFLTEIVPRDPQLSLGDEATEEGGSSASVTQDLGAKFE